MDEVNPLPGRTTHRLNLDSEEEQRREEQERRQRQQRQRQREQKKRRKQQRRKQRQQQQMEEKRKAQQQAEKKRLELAKFNDPSKLFEPDSDSEARFSYTERRIKALFPKSSKKNRVQSSDSQQDSDDESDESSDSESESEEDSESENSSEAHHRKKKQKMEKKRNREENMIMKNKNKSTAKVEYEKSAKQKLVHSLSIRWWYVLPEWPPVGYDYEGELKKQGYRLVKAKQFRIADEVVDGLQKVQELDGYIGIFKGKNGIIDVRPNQNKPCINFFNSKSESELHRLVKLALQRQIEQMSQIPDITNDQKQILEDLKRQLAHLG